jgi:RHS repeat-associated protein
MVVSQNTKQYNKSPKAFSYTKYDALGRIKEVGEKSENADSIGFYKIFGSDVGGMFNSNTINDDSLSTWLAGNGSRTEVTKTYYDTVVFNSLPVAQENLRKRVADVTYEDVDDEVDSTYQHATHYTYDIHGNVTSLVQDNPEVNVASQRYKRIDYDYDIITGKVHKVIYQPDAPDLFIHKYEYDADNRITRVETSTDDIIYQTDAKYFYYHHGPLARVEYGKNQVQGMDYAYTLQGLIKGVNSSTLKSSRDMGQDGLNDTSNLNQYFAEDAMGYMLGYYAGDYKAISGVKWSSVTNRFEAQTAGAQFEGQRHDLFNGNISHMVTTIVETNSDSATSLAEPQTASPLANAYKYDQLNRLKKSLSFNNVNIPNNLWSASGQTVSNMYENTFTYDANGNIITQNRFDEAGVKFENMDYRYKKDANGNFMHNRLYHVNDSASSGLQTDDIDDQGAFVSTVASINTVNNYRYDEIGNLIADSTEQIDTIKWTVYGKIKEIKRTSGSSKKNLKFEYDASGNRIAKQVLSSFGSWEKTTFYVRDAQGNVMSTYEESVVDSSFTFKLKEQHLYGSSRLGMVNPEREMIGADTTNEFTFDTLNKRQYEMANHLENVLIVTYDRKMAVDTNNDGIIDFRLADLASASDYSPFGSVIKGRGFVIDNYRYNFNGKELDTETNTQDYGMRIYNPGLGKFLSIDPITKDFPWYTPYQFAGNKPIACIDLDGLEDIFYGKSFKKFGNKIMLKILEATGLKKEAEKKFAKENSKYDLYIVVTPNPGGGVYRDEHGKLYDDGSMESTYLLTSDLTKEEYAKIYNMLKEQGLDPMKTIKAGKTPIIMEISEGFAGVYESFGLTKKDRGLGLYSLKVGAFTIWHGFQHANKHVEGKNTDPYGRDDHRDMYGKDYSADSYDWYGTSPSYNDIDDMDSPAGKAKEKVEKAVDKMDDKTNPPKE